MSEIYYIEAKTVEEAIAIANRKYSDDKHEVSTEIISLPKKGFLGFGAKDAKIKVTVTESQSAELSSIVSDMRKMKSLTNRGNDDRRETADRRPAAKPRQGDKPQPKKAEPTDKRQKGDKAPQPRQPQKPVQTANAANSAKPANAQPKPEKTAQPKTEKPAPQPKPKTEPKSDPVKQNPQTQPKPQPKQQPQQSAPQPQTVQHQPAPQTVQPAPQPTQQTQTPQPAERHSTLNNQVKSKSRRMSMNRTTPAREIDPSGVTVSAPIGVESFTANTKTSGFGSFSSGTTGAGRMSNDIKKKPRQTQTITDPGKANLDALKALTSQTAALQRTEKPAQPEKTAQPKPESKPETKPDSKPEPRESREVRDPREDRRKTARNQNKRQRPPRPQPSADSTAVPTPPITPTPTPAPTEEKVRECVTQEEMDFALEFANTLLTNMKLDAHAAQAYPDEEEAIEVKADGEANVYPKINIVGGDTGILIGHHGETLDSIQYLINLSAIRRSKQKDGDYVKIVVDIEGYREKREETLRSLARRMASRAVKYKRNIYLEPMNAYERRIIHSELQSFENVSTHSVGSDRDRKIVITYEGPDKRPYQKRERKPVDPTPVEPASIAPEKPEETRPNKPKKLPIEELESLLESREDHTAEDAIIGDETVEDVITEAPASENASTTDIIETEMESEVESAFEAAESALEAVIESMEPAPEAPKDEVTE